MKRTEIQVGLQGLVPILFDKYAGDNQTKLDWKEKVYLDSSGKNLILPSINLSSFLTAQNTESSPQRVVGRGWKAVAKAAQSFVMINPMEIPILRNGKPLTRADVSLRRDVARVVKGKLVIPMPKERPQLNLPWGLEFNLTLLETPELGVPLLKKLFVEGGLTIGLGTWRGMFGKFSVSKWEVTP